LFFIFEPVEDVKIANTSEMFFLFAELLNLQEPNPSYFE